MSKEQKDALRREIKIKREGLTAEYLKDSSRKIADFVTGSDLFQSAKTLFVYISMKDEPDTTAIIEAAFAAGKTVCVPKCYGKGIMSAVVIHSFEDLKPGMLNIPEPADCSQVVEEDAIDLGIIPCISANRKGERIGHGAGYYDRFFEKAVCAKICLCFEKLSEDNIPMDELDVKMEYVATEKGLFRAQ